MAQYVDSYGYVGSSVTGDLQNDDGSGTRYTGKTWDPWGYGNKGYDVVNGKAVEGSSGYDQASGRYQGMGRAAGAVTAPHVGSSRERDARGFQMGSLGLLGDAAYGRGPSIAGQEAIRAGQSLASSVKGGPGARIAAMRNATQQAGSQYAMARAKEMADARGQYFGATTGMRGQDIDLAKAQSDAEARQRALNAQQQQAYEKMAADVRKQQLDSQIAQSGAELGSRRARQDEGDFLTSDARAKENVKPLVMGSLASLYR